MKKHLYIKLFLGSLIAQLLIVTIATAINATYIYVTFGTYMIYVGLITLVIGVLFMNVLGGKSDRGVRIHMITHDKNLAKQVAKEAKVIGSMTLASLLVILLGFFINRYL